MKDYIQSAIGGVQPPTQARNTLRTAMRRIGSHNRPALRLTMESLIHEQMTNPSPELDRDIAELLTDLGGDQASLESMASMEGKTGDVLYGIWRGIWAGYYGRKDRKAKAKGEETWPEKKAREKREEEERKRLYNKEFRVDEIISFIKKSYSDRSWVMAQTLVDGDVSSEAIALHIRTDKAWAGQDIVGCFAKCLDNLKKVSKVLLSDGVKYGSVVRDVERELNAFIISHCEKDQYGDYKPKTDEDAAAISAAYKKAIAKLSTIRGPEKYLAPLKGMSLPGGTVVEIDDWMSGVYSSEKPQGQYPAKVPALKAEDVVKLAGMVIEQFNIIKEIETRRREIEVVIYHDDGSPINDMYDHIGESEALYMIVSDQTANDVSIGDLIDGCMMTCKAAFAYMDRCVKE